MILIGIFKYFEFCVCPVITGIARGSTPTIQKLNQATSYYIRVRSRRASGVAEPWSIVYPFRTPVNAAQVTTPAAVMVPPSIVVTPASGRASCREGGGQSVSLSVVAAPLKKKIKHTTK